MFARSRELSARSVHQIPGNGSQFAAVETDILQGAVIQFVDAGELGTIAKIATDRFVKECDEHGPGFPDMSMV